MPKLIRIFLSSPNDVQVEQIALKSLVSELNDFLIFLAPERDMKIEVIHYDTHTYPDISGGPQSAVDRQIPEDYEIHFGVMWKRCGTPTADADSGTIHEFETALARRKSTGRPLIMFYFSDEKFSMPNLQEDFDQIALVRKFRQRISTMGLTVLYDSAQAFRDRARINLLRAIADLTRTSPTQQNRISEGSGEPDHLATRTMLDLAIRYDSIRRDMEASYERTEIMTKIFEAMADESPKCKKSLSSLILSRSAGQRLSAIAILRAFPDPDYVEWLADRLEPESEAPFVGYQASVALISAARSFPPALGEKLSQTIIRAKRLASKNPNDPPRIAALESALNEVNLRKKFLR